MVLLVFVERRPQPLRVVPRGRSPFDGRPSVPEGPSGPEGLTALSNLEGRHGWSPTNMRVLVSRPPGCYGEFDRNYQINFNPN
jgi:hypothetical protein